jgi:phosphatidylinositol alpha 1,6-mannosyltransferase
VHVFTPEGLGIRALRQARRLDIPTVVTETSPRAEFAPPRWQEQVADRADRLTVTASWLRDRVEAAGLSASLWTPGVDTEVFQPGRRDEALRRTWTDGDLTQVVVGHVGSGDHARHRIACRSWRDAVDDLVRAKYGPFLGAAMDLAA